MSTEQGPVTIGQPDTDRQEGGVDSVTRDVTDQPDRYTFADMGDLTAYLSTALGGHSDGAGVRGSVSHVGTRAQRTGDGGTAFTSGDPVLDAVSPPAGTIVVAGESIDLREGYGSPQVSSGGGAVAATSPLVFTSIVNGAERWASDDGATVEYRIGSDRLTFHAWNRRRLFPPYWSTGAKVFSGGTDFEAANVFAYYYMSVTAPCEVVAHGEVSSFNDSSVDQYEWGVNAPQPERVAALCRAQWHQARFADVVTAGEGCLRYRDEAWPSGYPSDWRFIWERIAGALKYVSVASDGTVWGVNASDKIYRRAGNAWTQVPGALKQLSVANASTIWGVNGSDDIFRWNGNGWTRVAGALKQVSVASDGTVWGVNASDKIYRRAGNAWTQVPGALKQLSVANASTIWGVNGSDDIFRWNGNGWTRVAGALKHVSVAVDGTVWGVNASDEIYRRTAIDDEWTQVHGALKQLETGSTDVVWGVNSADNIFTMRVP